MVRFDEGYSSSSWDINVPFYFYEYNSTTSLRLEEVRN